MPVVCNGYKMKDLLKNYRKFCEEIPLFAGMKGEDLLSLFECLRAFIKTYEKDEYIVLYNDSVECVGVLLEGTVHMIKEDLRETNPYWLRLKRRNYSERPLLVVQT